MVTAASSFSPLPLQWVLAFEIFIPLVLFFILLGLRQKKPAIAVKEGKPEMLEEGGASKGSQREMGHLEGSPDAPQGPVGRGNSRSSRIHQS